MRVEVDKSWRPRTLVTPHVAVAEDWACLVYAQTARLLVRAALGIPTVAS